MYETDYPEPNNNWNWGVGGAVLRSNEILLVRHTYGAAKGQLLIPGGYVQNGEMPEAAVVREVHEETGVTAAVKNFIGIRFQIKNWYAVFLLDYVSGEPISTSNENDFAGFMQLAEAAQHKDMTKLSRLIVDSVMQGINAIPLHDYYTGKCRNEYMIYGIERKSL